MGLTHTGLCDICGKNKATDTHHLIYSRSDRSLSDDDGLTAEICRECHQRIHGIGTAGHLSKMLGQMMYICDRMAEGYTREEANDLYLKRYGNSRI